MKTIIFDLSEVFIGGMHGIGKSLAPVLNIPAPEILPLMSNQWLRQLFQGLITEDQYLQELLASVPWSVSPAKIKEALRANFHTTIPGMDAMLPRRLADRYTLVLLSDHAREWVEYLRPVHQSLLSQFSHVLFSFDPRLRGTKKEAATFHKVLQIVDCQPSECLFIDDSKRNINTAQEVGIPGVLFTSAQRLITVEFPQFGITLDA